MEKKIMSGQLGKDESVLVNFDWYDFVLSLWVVKHKTFSSYETGFSKGEIINQNIFGSSKGK